MTTFTGTDVSGDVRRILNDAGGAEWADATLVANINMAVRAVNRDATASCFSSPIAFKDNIAAITALADTIAMDVWWRDAVAHYTAYLCFTQNTRDTVNAAFAERELRLYREAL